MGSGFFSSFASGAGRVLAAASIALLAQPGLASEWFRGGDAAAGEASFQQVCFACHGTGGAASITPDIPLLAGQHAGYLVKQLLDYKSGRRTEAQMNALVAAMDEQAFANIAAFLAAQPLAKSGEDAGPAAGLGERIFHEGPANEEIPACRECHGLNARGVPQEFPSLQGQSSIYIAGQLQALRAGERQDPIMGAVAAGLTDEEISAVAAYLASL